MPRPLIAATLLALGSAALSTSVVAQSAAQAEAVEGELLEQRAADVVAAFRGEKPAAEVFGPAFLAAVPEERLLAMNTQLAGQFGPLLGVESVVPRGASQALVTFRFERALGSGPMVLSGGPDNLVSGLRLSSFEPIDDSAEKIADDLSALPGDVSVYFGPLEGGEAVFAHGEDVPFPIGSTMKLYILSALSRSIADGERNWVDIVPLSVRSLPSGRLQDWPLGTPMTLQTLATMMISTSDNTATDQLLAVLGREAVEAELRASGHSDADGTLPFLSTLEMFALKSDEARGTAYAAASEGEQRATLAALASELRGSADNGDIAPWAEARLIDSVEWFASTSDLRGLLRRLVDAEQNALRIMAVNRAMPERLAKDWDYVGYKGGSEPGVLNYTWLLRDKDGAWHTLVMSWKDESNTLTTNTFDLLAQRIIALTP